MAMIPYSRQDITEDDIRAVTAVLRADFVTQGPQVAQFEAAFADAHETPHAVAVSSATAALHLACLALGVGPGSRVWTTPNSFLASANCALYCGASVDFVDIDPATRNLSTQALEHKLVEAARRNALPHVVIAVDFAGLPCDWRELRTLADRHGFHLIEDASHATGARYEGRPVGSAYADAAVFSFHAVKVLTSAEGGMVTTHDAGIAQRVRSLRSHGVTRDAAEMEQPPEGAWCYEQQALGFNYRMTDVQAALGASQLKRLSAMHARRVAIADRYDALLQGLPLQRPPRVADRVSAWHLYAIELDTGIARGAVFDAMRDADIGVNVHYIPIHTQPYYARLGFKRGDFPVAERYYAHTLSLPIFPSMTDGEQERVVAALKAAIS